MKIDKGNKTGHLKAMGKFLVENCVTDSSESKESLNRNRDMKIDTNDDLQLDAYFGPEIPPNILFPDQLNKYLREQIQNLALENGSLRRSLEEMQEELSTTKQKSSKPSLPITGRASEIAANKIAELSKKLREQTAELESMKTRAKDAEAKLRQAEANSVDQESTPPPPASEDEIVEKHRQIKTLTEKLQSANAKMCDFRNQCQALRQEMKLAQKVIESEVGEKVVWQDLAKENGSWRGRAQQIIALQNKIQHLQEQLSNTTVPETPAANVLRQMEKDRRASYEEATKQLNQKTIQMEEIRKKFEASKARNKVLENEIIQIKTKMSDLMDKSAKDEQLVATLTSQINVFEDRGKAQMQCFTKMQDNIYRLQQEMDVEKQKNEQLQKALIERENRIHKLEDQIQELKTGKNLAKEELVNVEPEPEPNKIVPSVESFDKRTFSVVDSERMRLLELLAVVNRRLDDSRREQMIAESQLRKEKFKNAKLETKVARLELERVGAIKTGRGSYSQNPNKVGEPLLDEANILARQHIEYLEEECLALKTRIETLQMERDNDLKVFAAMTDVRDNLFEAKQTKNSNWRKAISPRDKRSTCKLPNRRAKNNQNKVRNYSPASYSITGQSSFSSEESITQ